VAPIDPGPGRELVRGGQGRDRINARDSRRDTVKCGPGRDRVDADQLDRLRGCEQIKRQDIPAFVDAAANGDDERDE
jgi:hypothetical protein